MKSLEEKISDVKKKHFRELLKCIPYESKLLEKAGFILDDGELAQSEMVKAISWCLVGPSQEHLNFYVSYIFESKEWECETYSDAYDLNKIETFHSVDTLLLYVDSVRDVVRVPKKITVEFNAFPVSFDTSASDIFQSIQYALGNYDVLINF